MKVYSAGSQLTRFVGGDGLLQGEGVQKLVRKNSSGSGKLAVPT